MKRRFNQFKVLHKSIGVGVEGVTLSTKLFEGRNFEEEYLLERKEKLLEYLVNLSKNIPTKSFDELLKWLGIGKYEKKKVGNFRLKFQFWKKDLSADKTYVRAFHKAILKTRAKYSLWGNGNYESEDEALNNLIMEKIKEDSEKASEGVPLMNAKKKSFSSNSLSTLQNSLAIQVEECIRKLKDINLKISPPAKVLSNSVPFDRKLEEHLESIIQDLVTPLLTPFKEKVHETLRKIYEILAEPIGNLLKSFSEKRLQLHGGLSFLIASKNKFLLKNWKDFFNSAKKEFLLVARDTVSPLLQKIVSEKDVVEKKQFEVFFKVLENCIELADVFLRFFDFDHEYRLFKRMIEEFEICNKFDSSLNRLKFLASVQSLYKEKQERFNSALQSISCLNMDKSFYLLRELSEKAHLQIFRIAFEKLFSELDTLNQEVFSKWRNDFYYKLKLTISMREGELAFSSMKEQEEVIREISMDTFNQCFKYSVEKSETLVMSFLTSCVSTSIEYNIQIPSLNLKLFHINEEIPESQSPLFDSTVIAEKIIRDHLFSCIEPPLRTLIEKVLETEKQEN